ncbi:Hypothetical protein NocV09_02400310 [Nannochloropsis oceanica]
MGPIGTTEIAGAGAGATIEVLRFLHEEVQGRLLPRVREEYDAFEALTLDVIVKMKEKDEDQLVKRKQQEVKPKKRLLSSVSTSTTHSSVPSAPYPTLSACQKELCRRWFVRFVAMNDWLIHARTGLTRHSYQQHPQSPLHYQQQVPKGIVRYCDLDARHRLCNYKGSAGAYSTSCLDNALAAARLFLAAGSKKHHAVAESLDASLCECDNRLQDIATKVVTLVDRFKLSLPVPLRLDRNHGSESLEGVTASRGCLEPPSKKGKRGPAAMETAKEKNRAKGQDGGCEDALVNPSVCRCPVAHQGRWWLEPPSLASGCSSQEVKVYNIGFASALSDLEDNYFDEGGGHMRARGDWEGGHGAEGAGLRVGQGGGHGVGGNEGSSSRSSNINSSSREGRAVVSPRTFLAQYHKRTYRLCHENPSLTPSIPPSSILSVSSLLFRLALQVLQDTHLVHHHLTSSNPSGGDSKGAEWPCFTYLRVERGVNSEGEKNSHGGSSSSSSSNSSSRNSERFAPGQALDVRGMEPGKAIRLHLGVDPSRCVNPVPTVLLRFLDESQARALPPNPAMVASLLMLPQVKEGDEEVEERRVYEAPVLAARKDLEVLCAVLEGTVTADAVEIQDEEDRGKGGGRGGGRAGGRIVIDVDDEDEDGLAEPGGLSLQSAPAATSMPSTLDLSFHPLTPKALASLSAALPAFICLRLRACSLTSLPKATVTSTAVHLCELDLSYNPFVPSPTFPSLMADLLAIPSLTRFSMDGVPSHVAEPLACAFENRRRTVAVPGLACVSLCDNVWSPAAWMQVLGSVLCRALYVHGIKLSREGLGERVEVREEGGNVEGVCAQSQQALREKGSALEVLATRLEAKDWMLNHLAVSFPSPGDPVSLEPSCVFRALVRPSCSLTRLDLVSSSGPFLSLSAITDLFAALCHNTSLESLDLSHATSFASFPCAEPCLRLLARALQTNPERRLRALSLRGCGLGLKGLATLLAALLPSSSSDGGMLSCAPFDSIDLAENHDTDHGIVPSMNHLHDEADVFMLSRILPQLLLPTGPQLLATTGGKLELSGNGLVGLMNELGWHTNKDLNGWLQTSEEDGDDSLFFVSPPGRKMNMPEEE